MEKNMRREEKCFCILSQKYYVPQETLFFLKAIEFPFETLHSHTKLLHFHAILLRFPAKHLRSQNNGVLLQNY